MLQVLAMVNPLSGTDLMDEGHLLNLDLQDLCQNVIQRSNTLGPCCLLSDFEL